MRPHPDLVERDGICRLPVLAERISPRLARLGPAFEYAAEMVGGDAAPYEVGLVKTDQRVEPRDSGARGRQQIRKRRRVRRGFDQGDGCPRDGPGEGDCSGQADDPAPGDRDAADRMLRHSAGFSIEALRMRMNSEWSGVRSAALLTCASMRRAAPSSCAES